MKLPWRRAKPESVPKQLPPPDPPSYCAKCGSEIVEREYSYGFDVYSGDRKVAFYRACPNYEPGDESYGDGWIYQWGTGHYCGRTERYETRPREVPA